MADPKALARTTHDACVCGGVRRAARAITQLYDDILRPSGLRITQFGILGATMAMSPITLTRLARATVTDRTTLTRNLKLLEQQGLIRIDAGGDRREREISITREGAEALRKAYP
ncbi:MAG: MarR family winged helix-turn-helix transcriptional regulator, partial [Burkholderiales bacterium]